MAFRRSIRKILHIGTASLLATALTRAFGIAAAQAQPAQDGSETEWSVFDEPDKSFAVCVGKDLTEEGYTMLGGFGHEPSSHWVEIVPEQEHPEGSEIVVGAHEKAYMPGELTTIPQVERANRYITSNYSGLTGLPTPLRTGASMTRTWPHVTFGRTRVKKLLT